MLLPGVPLVVDPVDPVVPEPVDEVEPLELLLVNVPLTSTSCPT